MSFTTKQLSEYVEGVLHGNGLFECSGAEIDSRQPLNGKVFFALKGEHADGHGFVEKAALTGCSAVVVEHLCNVAVPQIVVPNAREALFQLAQSRRNEMDLKSVIAVTGSVGKTTTKDILGCLFGDNAVISIKSYNNDLGVPLTILAAEQASYLVTEIGANDVGEIEPLARLVQPDVAILTSIEKAHLEGFKNTKTVLLEKAKLLQQVPADGFVIVPDTIDLSDVVLEATVITVGKTQSADVVVETGSDSQGFATLRMGQTSVTLSLLGEHNAMNAALAIVAILHTTDSTTLDALLSLAAKAKAPTGRLQREEVNGVTFLDDSYNANPASMRSALQLFSSLQANRKVLVLGDMLELGESSHAEHRALISCVDKAKADIVIFVGTAFERVGCSTALHLPNADNLDTVVSLLHQGDLVLVKGSRGLRLERLVELFRQMKVLEH
jgi:UDP-N-acetylmuramoyl-tripeptide--D-alanyl-D-alanine ligase